MLWGCDVEERWKIKISGGNQSFYFYAHATYRQTVLIVSTIYMSQKEQPTWYFPLQQFTAFIRQDDISLLIFNWRRFIFLWCFKAPFFTSHILHFVAKSTNKNCLFEVFVTVTLSDRGSTSANLRSENGHFRWRLQFKGTFQSLYVLLYENT